MKTTGEGSSKYKREPWSHMNPYHISCQIQLPGAAGLPSFSKTPARVKIGVTDYWLPNVPGEMSSSGAKLYVQAKPEWSLPALRMVCSVLEEADIEIPPVGRSSAPRLFTSPEGRPWGRPRVDSASLRQRWEAQLGITAASVSAAAKGEVEMAPDKVRVLLDRIAIVHRHRAVQQQHQPLRPGPRLASQRHSHAPLGRGMGCPCSGHSGLVCPGRSG